MFTRSQLWIAGSLVLVLGFTVAACSSKSSNKNLILCWLRPSCLPSELPSTNPATVKKSKPSTPSRSSRVTNSKTVNPTSPKPTSSSANCPTVATAHIQGPKPSITMTYTEPTTNEVGKPLTNLAKTTIYYDVGKGLVRAKEVPATNPQGGGKITESIQIPLGSKKTADATICITATSDKGLENHRIVSVPAATKDSQATKPKTQPTKPKTQPKKQTRAQNKYLQMVLLLPPMALRSVVEFQLMSLPRPALVWQTSKSRSMAVASSAPLRYVLPILAGGIPRKWRMAGTPSVPQFSIRIITAGPLQLM